MSIAPDGIGREQSVINKAGVQATLAAELLLLLRVVLSDDALGARERAVLRRVSKRSFGIEGAHADAVLAPVAAFASKGGAYRARMALREGGRDHCLSLARMLCDIADDDPDLKTRRNRMVARLADILDLESDAL